MSIRIPFVFFFSFIIISCCYPQLIITVTSIPANTPPNDDIYIAGNFNNWNPGDPNYKLTNNGNGTFTITIMPSPGLVEFKFTRGTWATVEGTSAGTYIPNRTFMYTGGVIPHSVAIAGWEGAPSPPEGAVIYDEDFYMPQLDRTRRIWVYLPPDYATSENKRYPVIYMHDGQNLFDANYSFAGEWEIDESMNEAFAEGDRGAIVIGIDNGGAERFDEYCPWYHPQYGGGDGEAYVEFLVETLKPHIDSTFRTLPGREFTATAGSSMGGLISMYAIAAHPDVFSKAGIFSPAFWVADSLYTYVATKTFTDPVRIYFVASETESQSMIPDMEQMRDLLETTGVPAADLLLLNEPDGAHSEWFWAREYPDAYEWLFDGIVLTTKQTDQKKIEVVPNPARDEIHLPVGPATGAYHVINMHGSKCATGKVINNRIDIGDLAPGVYWLRIQSEGGALTFSRFIKI
jgi:predicted alpha/beta superfamily hydrolase